MKIIYLLILTTMWLLGGCQSDQPESQCVRCHANLELASPSHADCVACHGADASIADKDEAHELMFGPRNPSSPQFWEKSCGACHQYQLKRMQANLMFTNTGFIKNIRLTWEGGHTGLYATSGQKNFNAQGEPVVLQDVTELDNMAGELYRKYCSLCHVASETHQSWRASHASGCAACHFPFNNNATYQGSDLAMRGKWPHSVTHQMAVLPNDEVCFHCHNRSGRIALSYQGLNDGNNGSVPIKDAFPLNFISGARNVTHIQADIHHDKGLECIDCHTSRDVMGDGYVYENMYLQTEISCEDCHGSGSVAPQFAAVTRENAAAVRESRGYKHQVQMGDNLVQTAKGRSYSNVFYRDGQVLVVGKRNGVEHVSKVITGTAEHQIVGHQRLECYACHTASVPQCFGCHTQYDKSQNGYDFVKEEETAGAFSEQEDYRSLYPFPLALDQRGKIAPLTPGCQTFISVIDENGTMVKQEYVTEFKGKKQLRFAPFYSHNTIAKAVGCSECHADPAFLGFGQHVVAGQSIESTLLCEHGDDVPLDGFMLMQQGNIESFAAVVREHSRPLNEQEVRRVLAVNQCLVCHDDPRDSIYQQAIDYAQIEKCFVRAAAK